MISTIKATDIFDFLKDTSAPDTTLSDWRDALEDADVMAAMAKDFDAGEDDKELEDKVNAVHSLIVSFLNVGNCPANEFYRFVTPLFAA